MKGLVVGGLALLAAVAVAAAVTGRVVSEALAEDAAHKPA